MNPLRVIIVEDDARIADLHRRFVERVAGFVVAGIAHGLADARDMAFALEPDLILLDLYFPEGSGMDLLRDVRAKGLETDVILITAAREVGSVKEALRGGVFDYIIKPVIAARFADCLENFRAYRARLAGADAVEQRDVDSLLRPAGAGGGHGPQGAVDELPKGIDSLTLGKVRAVFQGEDAPDGLSAENVAARIGVSRSTARRYLEYLVSVDAVVPDVVYGSVGRPERRYFKGKSL
ncbi:MAG: response regulator [Desulfovibrionaceae bacterium]